jgi:hypothetical protein
MDEGWLASMDATQDRAPSPPPPWSELPQAAPTYPAEKDAGTPRAMTMADVMNRFELERIEKLKMGLLHPDKYLCTFKMKETTRIVFIVPFQGSLSRWGHEIFCKWVEEQMPGYEVVSADPDVEGYDTDRITGDLKEDTRACCMMITLDLKKNTPAQNVSQPGRCIAVSRSCGGCLIS